MLEKVTSISPIDGRVVATRDVATQADVERTLGNAIRAQKEWKGVSLAERCALLSSAVDAFVRQGDDIARELTLQMGRPITQTPGEVRGFEERARYMISVAEEALADVDAGPKTGFHRFIRREPLGVVLSIVPWNYPYLTAVNTVFPAILAGNVVILRHAPQTLLAAERIAEAFAEAGVPEGVLQVLHTSDDATDRLIATPGIDFVAFTGSVRVGHVVQQFASQRFVGVGLELGGKDPAYVRGDARLNHAIENLVDGSFFNSGQSCCAIERIYVHESVYEPFVAGFVELTRKYRLGDPLDPDVNLGPVVRPSAADFVRKQIDEAISAGARALIEPGSFARNAVGTPYLAPQVLVNVDHRMRVMMEESFGPVVGIMKVGSDEDAVRLMNDSPYGLTASVWTSDEGAALRIGDAVDTGTVFMNRCDYLDPALAWTGVKDSGRGVTLSRLGYEVLTRPKSYHLRTKL